MSDIRRSPRHRKSDVLSHTARAASVVRTLRQTLNLQAINEIGPVSGTLVHASHRILSSSYPAASLDPVNVHIVLRNNSS